MPRAYISVGSNIDPEKNVKEALRLLTAKIPVAKISTVYYTEPEQRPEPWSKQPPESQPEQPWYYNCVIEINTELRPEELKYAVLRDIEKKLGRKRTADKFASRTIDLDLIFYDGLAFESPGFTLPDPDIFRRLYLLSALRELSPDLKLTEPRSNPVAILEEVSPPRMEALEAYTQLLRKEISHGG